MAIIRPSIVDLIKSKKSMLGEGALPQEYARIEDETDVKEALKEDRQVRIHIVWDNSADGLPLEPVLDHMRETGAAMVLKVERIDR